LPDRYQKHHYNQITSDGNNFLSLLFFPPVILYWKTKLYTKTYYMNELVERLIKEANLDPKQAQKAIETIASFVKEKFPMLGGAVDQIFTAGAKEDQGI